MAITTRVSIPEEFFDITSAQLLVQPEPQYFYAVLLKMALNYSLQLTYGGPIGVNLGTRPIQDGGAAYTGALYDRLMLQNIDPVYGTSAINVVPELGSRVGHTVRINRPKFGSGGFTLASREVAAGSTISLTPIDISSEQATLTLKRYAGPYDSVNSNVAPFALDKLDSSRAVHSMSQIAGKHLQRDLDRWLDAVLVTLFNLGSTPLWPQGFTADANSQVAGDMPMDCDMIFRAEETLKNANVPRFANGRYMMVCGPTQTRQLKNDPQFDALSKYFPQTNPLFQSYIGTVGGVDIFESTTLTATNNAQSVPVFTSHCFGPSMVGNGIGRLPEVMPSTDDNYGEVAKVIWILYAAFAVLDNRFGVQLHTT